MSVLLQWTVEGEDIALELDVAPTETYEASVEVTKHPVETGSAISDHVSPTPSRITLEGLITNTPIRTPRTQTRGLARAPASITLTVAGQEVRVQLAQWSGPLDRVRECDELLASLVNAGVSVTLTTSLRVTEHLILVRYSVARTVDNGSALPVTLEFEQIRVVSTSRVAVPAVRRLQTPQARGQQPAAPAPSSALVRMRDAFRGRSTS